MSSLFKGMDLTSFPANAFNIAPTESVSIIFTQDNTRKYRPARWWLTPSWAIAPDATFATFNARSEGLLTSRAYKNPFRYKRCIIPATSFLEWQKTESGKRPIEIYRENNPILFAGLWDCWKGEHFSCSIVTTAAPKSITPIHSRMPVMLDANGIERWLSPESSIPSLKKLFSSQLCHQLMARPVGLDINNARTKVPPTAVGESWALN